MSGGGILGSMATWPRASPVGIEKTRRLLIENGGDFRIWERMLPEASGTLVFEGEAGKERTVQILTEARQAIEE